MKIIKRNNIRLEGDQITPIPVMEIVYKIELDLDELEHMWQLANYAHRKGDDLFLHPKDKQRNIEIHNQLVLALGFGRENFI